MGKRERQAADPIRQAKPDQTHCPDCGAPVPGGVAGCRALFGELQIRNQQMGDLNLLRMCVDAYSLQHPEPYLHSAKSQAGHLVSICWLLEYSASPKVWKALQSRLNVHAGQAKLSTPAQRGRITLVDVFKVAEPAAYRAAVRNWAQCAWDAWKENHAAVRRWIADAVAEK